jgi:ATP-binding cassette subfamily F protein 3
VQEYDGDLEEYRAWLSERRAREAPSAEVLDKTDSAQARKDRKRADAERRQREQPLRKKVKELEAKLEALAQRRAEIDAQLAGGEVYAGANKGVLKDLLRDQARVNSEIAAAEEAWLDASEALQQPAETGPTPR